MSYLSAIATAVPENCFSQETLTDFYIRSTNDLMSKRKIKIVSGKTGIQTRYSVLSDFDKAYEDYTFFSKSADLLPEPTLSDRMKIYAQQATELSLKAVNGLEGIHDFKEQITHLITVTCTGLFAPGLDIELMRALSLSPTVQRSSVNFMGCNAAILALKNADVICRTFPAAKVLIVCTELCTIHFQKQYNDDYLLSNLLFADGAAAVIVSGKPDGMYQHAVQMEEFNSMVLHSGYDDMAWRLSETGFIMNLSSYVPGLIRENIRAMLLGAGLNIDQIKHWAVHPGGKRIIDDFALALNLDKCAMSDTYKILKNYGNMSSPTVLFVLKEILEKAKSEHRNEQILAAAFGPGLTIETLKMRYV
ncbi:Alpha-pyrone synthesis polyketide synthase-like Pks18 [Dyadobacter sp. CECT 9275]|uniref:Alpha-pyrone synthesis polyketide synthase-like Pks18 n=1 Tax=Dyadobacter helix TaxID=2822344 RepID=A0A916JIY1_9BACT|nr:type III polyketide synthase [Dyadobacter sp. CECT 9275]CAG5017589.1 Alpha-pyrone synthesis polyketide synthase-like Pks18 [Dyadobacter sp. CECT 9275]